MLKMMGILAVFALSACAFAPRVDDNKASFFFAGQTPAQVQQRIVASCVASNQGYRNASVYHTSCYEIATGRNDTQNIRKANDNEFDGSLPARFEYYFMIREGQGGTWVAGYELADVGDKFYPGRYNGGTRIDSMRAVHKLQRFLVGIGGT
jgi:hypothetical protein